MDPWARILFPFFLIRSQIGTTFDALSQLAGRWIPCRYQGGWHRFTRDANESISGAAHWHRTQGRFPYVARAIDAAFRVFGSDGHCRMVYINDLQRSERLLREAGYLVKPRGNSE